jgi:hypothetical protein
MDLLRQERFPRIWVPSLEVRDGAAVAANSKMLAYRF